MPRKPTPPPETEIAVVRDLAQQLAKAEQLVDDLRLARNLAMVRAKTAGATGDHLAEASDIARRNAVEIVRQFGTTVPTEVIVADLAERVAATAVVHQEDDQFVARATTVDVASQGRSEAEARANLKEAVELHFTNQERPQ